MPDARIVTDLEECRALWERLIPQEGFWDLWDVRMCFQQHYRRPPCFVVLEEAGECKGLLPLSWVEESSCYQYFPGETWSGATWVEQNRIIAHDEAALGQLLAAVPQEYHVRYLKADDCITASLEQVDEIGYLFLPPRYEYSIERYFQEFSGKTFKRLQKELAAVEAPGAAYRLDDCADIEWLVDMNLRRFGAHSYFYDERFCQSFRSLMELSRERGWLRVTTVLLGGEIAAVDVGVRLADTYILLGGGTNPDYPGVAKLINLYHMRRACAERIPVVDFLCGDFSWKKLFHLTQRPLYLLTNSAHFLAHPMHPEEPAWEKQEARVLEYVE